MIRVPLILGDGLRDHLIVLVALECAFLRRDCNLHILVQILDVVDGVIADLVEICRGQVEHSIRIPLADLCDNDVQQNDHCHKDHGHCGGNSAVLQLLAHLHFLLPLLL